MSKVISTIVELVGETPLYELQGVVPVGAAKVYVKLESATFGGTAKVRTVLNQIELAEEAGMIAPGDRLVEATNNNAGVAVAMLAAAKGYRAVLVLPDGLHPSVHALIEAYGAEIVVTVGTSGFKGAIAEAERLGKQEGYFNLSQFDNSETAYYHEQITATEIIDALDGESPDAFVAGVGSGSTLTGVGRAFRVKKPNVAIYAVEPEESQTLSGGMSTEHELMGIGVGFIPKTLDTTLYNGVIRVTESNALHMCTRLAFEEGLLLGPSSGAAIHAAIEIAKRLGRDKKVVTVSSDLGDRYLVNT